MAEDMMYRGVEAKPTPVKRTKSSRPTLEED